MPTTYVVTTSWPHEGDPLSGTFVAADVAERSRRGERLVVLVPRGPGQPVRPPGAQVVELPHGALFGTPGTLERLRGAPWKALGLLPFLAALRAQLRVAHATDRVVAHWFAPTGLLVANMLAPGVALRAVAHGGDVRLLSRAPALRLWARAQARRFEVVQAVSPALAERLTAMVPGLRIEIAPMPLDSLALELAQRDAHEVRRRCPADVEARATALRVVAARLIAAKRIERALDDVARRGGYLVVLGDGPERGRLTRRATALGIRHHFAGMVTHQQALTWLAAADEVLAPLAPDEGAPTVVLEAQALGVTVTTYEDVNIGRRKK